MKYDICSNEFLEKELIQQKEIHKIHEEYYSPRTAEVEKYYSCDVLIYVEQQLSQLQQENNKLLQKLVYNLSPTTHELSTAYIEKFKEIIRSNIDLESCKIKRLLKECWEDKTFSQSEYLKESDRDVS